MKNYYILILLVISPFVFSQTNFEKDWQEVYQYELDGKTRSANEVVQEIYKKAKRKKDEIQIIKCFFYISKFTQVLEEEAHSKIIGNLNKEIKEANPTSKAVLNYVYAKLLENYVTQNRYKISQRTQIANENETDFLAWSLPKFEIEIEKAYESTLENKSDLQQKNILNYKDIFVISPDIDAKNYTLYDFLWDEILKFRKNKTSTWEINLTVTNNSVIEKLYANSATFLNTSTEIINDTNFKKIIQLLQEYENLYINKDKDKTDEAHGNRLNYIHSIFKDNSLYIKELKLLEETTKNKYLQQQLKVDRANYYYAITQKNSEKNYYKEVIAICDSVLQNRNNNNALAAAETLKNNILRKSLNVQIKKTLYENENNRAYVSYKNIDTLTIHYYNIPKDLKISKYSTKESDSIFRNIITKKEAITSFIRMLPNKNDYFEYTTEILLEKMPIGDYLLVFQPNNNPLDINNFEYETITVSNITFIKDSDEKHDYFYASDRKTGRPLQNIIIKNNEATQLTDALGKVSFKKKKYAKGTTTASKVLFIQDKDTLISNYNKGWLYESNTDNEEDYENFEAKAKVYFDRAIYRPGQKVYYKGIMIQDVNGNKSVVPYVTVLVTIEDENYTTLKEYEVQTNEFGSFTGEFDIPKNVLTGQFTITIDEPEHYENDKKYYDKKEDEHQFWDNVDYDYDNEFHFQVEEYKRPTFEVAFETIKENYTIGDTLKIIGNAKTLTGSTLTYAKVNYSISKRIYPNEYNQNQKRQDINKTIETDAKGNFTILLVANDSLIANNDIREINYAIQAEVIDLNGETRTATKQVTVGNKTLKLDINTNPTLYKEDENQLTITATTLNDYAIDTKGKIEIYYTEKQQFLKGRLFSIPEIQTIKKDDFKSLFPNEPYDSNETKVQEILIKTITFDTKNGKTIALDFLKKLKKGNYKLVAKALDSKKNEIENTRYFELKSRNEIFDETVLFTFKNVTDTKSDYFEFELQSVIPDLSIFSRYYIGKELKKEIVVQLKNGIGTLKIKKNTISKENFHFHFSTHYDNEYFNRNYTIAKEEIEKKLEFEIVSLRNKIEPGSKENWSFKIVNQQLETEVLASMYDSSLDQFAKENWNTNLMFNHYYNNPSYPSFYDYNIENISFNKFNQITRYYNYYIKKPELNWFGFHFNDANNKYVKDKYIKTIEPLVEIPINAKMLTGTVLDENGLPLPSVSIQIQGTKRGTQTDFDGNFSIQAKANEILTFSYISMIDTYYTSIGKNEKITIIMKEDAHRLEAVVVTAYGIQTKKANLSYATTTIIDSSYADDAPILQALMGTMPGVQVAGIGENSQRIIIRGVSSISGNNEALIIVDGVPMSTEDFKKLTVGDIESFSVLKDASATALYGSRASGGAIIITTKKALKEIVQVKTRTNFNETAFFFPQLQTDKEGKVSFSFTSPESLTRWKLRLLGHNKNFETGYFQSDVISQKDIMVMPNLPRFVREKDTITIVTKVVNMTNDTKTGLAMLLLYDATNGKAIDSIAYNQNNSKNFICKPKESISVSWTIAIPENLQGLHYKIVAKSGAFSDGEENILPVLSNKILVTESIPIWVRENSTKDYVFENLKNNSSTTLQNHSFTLEYTTNPIWFAIQSLPYLMEFEHECAEQTFSRYYANTIANEIVTKNSKIASLFESYRNEKTPKNKLQINEALKSILLAETPWFFDSENEVEKNKQLAYLFDLATLKNKQEQILEKLEAKLLPSGGFPWFDGGQENQYITQHILAGIGHLNALFPNDNTKYKAIVSKGIPYLDQKFMSQYIDDKTLFRNYSYNDIHYLYMRSFYVKEYPLSVKLDSLLQLQLKEVKQNWLTYSLFQKAQLALVFNRFGDVEMAKKMIIHLKETASLNEDLGMYWLENTKSWYWYQAPIETQALLIEAFNEVTNDTKSIDLMKVWLLKNKQNKNWTTTKATTEAIYAILLQGSDWTSVKDKTKFKIGNEKILSKKMSTKEKEVETGYIKINWKADEISKDMATIHIENKSNVPSYGGIYWQYFEDLENIKESTNAVLNIKKEVFKKDKTGAGAILKAIEKEDLKVGDIITIRLTIKAIEDLEFVHLKDLRASCFEPLNVISSHERKDNLFYYKSTKDVATHFFFDKITKGTYVLEYEVRINNSGNFNDGFATLQSMYAPEFSANSTNCRIMVTK